MKDSYILHTSVSGFDILLLSVIFDNKNYGVVEYRTLYKDDVSLMYLTKTGYKQAYQLSKKLLNDKFFSKLIKDSEDLNKALKSYEVPTLTRGNVLKEWKRYLEIFNEFCYLYKFYEQPFQQALEEVVLKHVPEDKLVKVLSNPSEGSMREIKNDYARAILDKLIRLGKLKLKIHHNAENLVTRDIARFINFLSKESNLSTDIVGSFTASEFIDALKGKLPSLALVIKRLDGCAIIKKRGKWYFEAGDKYLYWENRIKDTENKEIRGKIAYPGKVQGRVVLHQSWTNTRELADGDILVTGMTNPQMVPFIKKAAAIVTDEGGITCHAAIISREMKKPCITGTKNATQLLKAGDLVEVDANNGLVKIIKKKETGQIK